MSFKMFPDIEKRRCKSILKKLRRDELISLKDTVTRGRITTKSNDDTIKAILDHSDTAKSLLTRKKLSRNYLYQYITENGIKVPDRAEKKLIIDKILELLKSDLAMESKRKKDTASTSKDSTAKVVQKNKNGNQKTDGNLGSVTNIGSNQQEAKKSPSKIELEEQLKYSKEKTRKLEEQLRQHEEKEKKEAQEKKKVGNKSGEEGQHNSPKHTTTTTSSQSSALNVNLNVDQGNQEFAETFVRWFYKMLNSQNPSLDETPEDFGPEHFWDDISLQIFIDSSNPKKFDGFERVSGKLLAYAKEELYLFIPNISAEGVRSKKGPHDHLGISVCGMVHQKNTFIGTFEQDFGLAQSLKKIKRMTLKLRSSIFSVATMPKLEEGKDLLAITVD